ncbi:transcriptional regulator, LysR family [Anaeromyxobacter dehalogenans 2CP-1]|uniref:Transcriptional regulator, LysR family n=1 Tax=Anaeromyxobacter dehalogenans (strain ATCC BAA-258 / DSM 21875 / 2CP-1) TaxID=455488 RepID=B8JC14_ANAD2|nr:LysR substrate-binding domain-containing protein [Anaeromyxobacter dehalogenans]ACL63936.1 transcriptional regulator, LysR family [Anaeromyxobacter dehalogenans 2CP-1]
MDRLHQLQVFVAVAEAGGFARAGARLRLSPPAVTRAIAALEGRVGARLFNRTTRTVRPTEAGLRFLEPARRVLADLETAEREAAGEGAAPAGHLTLTASVTFGRWALAPVVRAFLGLHPGVTASLVLVDRVVNLVEEGVDVAVRIGQLPDSDLVARKVGEIRRVLVASPAYLRAHGAPSSPARLRAHAVIAFTGLHAGREWRFVDGGRQVAVPVAPRLVVNDALAALDAAEAGDGITLALSYMVAERIAAGRLVPVLGRFAPPPVPVQLVHPHARLVAPKVRAFVDFAAPRLAAAIAALPPIPERSPRSPRRPDRATRA